MFVQRFLLTSGLAVVAIASVAAPVTFHISNALCPLIPPPPVGSNNTCGPYTYRSCDTPSASCAYCKPAGGAALLDFTGYVDPPKEYVVDVENYAFYHMLHVEYLVEFSKNPMPFQTPVSLPHCGINPHTELKRDLDEESLERRGGWKIPKKIGGTLGQIGEGIKHAGQEIQKGAGSIPIPWVSKAPTPPKFLPRPLCIPNRIEVPVHFTVFTTNFTTSTLVNTAVLETQIQVTNKAFEPLGISFYISSLSYHIGREWERFTHNKNGGDVDYYAYAQRIKAENRYGGNDEVSIWVVEKIDEIDCETGARTNGYCTQGRNVNTAGHTVDGCAITIDSLPGIRFRDGPGTGSTLTHELGHWFDLDHIFPETTVGGCDGESDLIEDTFQFPNDEHKFEKEQFKCCSTKSGNKLIWSFCGDGKTYNVTNYMSYSRNKGQIIHGNEPGTMPWTTEQRSHMFASYFTHRRVPPNKVTITCNDYPVFFNELSSEVKARASFLDERSTLGFALRGPKLLKQGSRLLEQLIKRCASPPDPNLVEAINIYTGEVVTCDMDGSCKPPSDGPRCPDGSSPPCRLDQYCLGGSKPPCDLVEVCPDNTAPPCPGNGGSTCPDGLPSSCSGLGPDKVKPDDKGKKPGEGDEPGDKSERPTCPAGCKVHDNKCDKTTAPTCIFPDPRVPNPRGACACRPGFKASGYKDTDTTKQWRLPIPGQEHRVWVAEGVACDQLCTVSTGVGSCKEVNEVAEGCAGY
ncbi:Fc.00g095590.m01.CDS01 [Cosmosporella sp. VM-42]